MSHAARALLRVAAESPRATARKALRMRVEPLLVAHYARGASEMRVRVPMRSMRAEMFAAAAARERSAAAATYRRIMPPLTALFCHGFFCCRSAHAPLRVSRVSPPVPRQQKDGGVM